MDNSIFLNIYIGEDTISDLNDFLEASGNFEKVKSFDEILVIYENELTDLESTRTSSQIEFSASEEKLQELKEKLSGSNNGVESQNHCKAK